MWKKRLLSTNVLFPIALGLVLSDAKFNLMGIPSFLVAVFAAYVLSWELAHLLRPKAHASDAFTTSLALMMVGGFFYFGRSDQMVAHLMAQEGQRAAFQSFAWYLNDLVLLALSLGMMTGLLVIFVSILSYIAFGQLKAALSGMLSSLLVGGFGGIGGGALAILSPPNCSWWIAPTLILGTWLGVLLAEFWSKPVGERRKQIAFGVVVTVLMAMVSSALAASLLTHRPPRAEMPELMAVCVAVGIGALAQALLMPLLRRVEVPAPEAMPSFIPQVGWFCQRFFGLMLAAPIALWLS